MVTPLERVMAALTFQEPDRVPVMPLVLGAARRVLGITMQEFSTNPELAAQAILQSQELLGYDGIMAALDLSVEAADFGAKMVYPLEDAAHPDYDFPRIKEVADYTRLEPYDPRETPRCKNLLEICRTLVKAKGREVPIMSLVNGPLCALGMLRGAERLFADCLKHPKEVHQALEVVTEVLVSFVKAQCETGVHAVCTDVLYGAKGTMSKKLWQEIEAPYAKRVTDAIRSCGRAVALHNCGYGPYFDLMIEHLQPMLISHHYLPPDCANGVELKEKYGNKVAIAGFVDCPQVLFLENPQQVKEECRSEIEALKKGGGYILASGCEFPPNATLLNARAMVEAAKAFGTYS